VYNKTDIEVCTGQKVMCRVRYQDQNRHLQDTWLLLNYFDWCYEVFVMILIMTCYILLMKLYPVTLNLIWSQDPWFTCKIGKNCQFMDFNLPFLTYLSIFIYVRCIKLCIVWAPRLAARVFTLLYCCKML
jgi:hypothetical protein